MGSEATVTARFNGKTDSGKARLETAVLALLAVGAAPRPATAAPPPGASVDVWARGASRDGDGGKRLGQRRFLLDRLPLASVERHDAQYEAVRQYRGIPLAEILKLEAGSWKSPQFETDETSSHSLQPGAQTSMS